VGGGLGWSDQCSDKNLEFKERIRVRLIRTLLAFLMISGCASQPSSRTDAPAEARRAPAATAGQVPVDLPDGRSTRLPAENLNIPLKEEKVTADGIGELIRYISRHREALGAKGDIGFALFFKSQRREGRRHYLRFDQIVYRHFGQIAYAVPVVGASIVAFVEPEGLVRLNSNLMTPASLGPSLKNPGFVFAWTDAELALFMTKIKTSPESQALLKSYFGAVARRAKRDFDFEAFLNRTLREQRETLNWFFGGLGRVSTARILTDLAREHKLAIVRHGKSWMFQIEGFFDLPLEFDIVIPKHDSEKLTVKNLRHLHLSVSETQGFTSPFYPNKPQKPGGPQVDNATPQFKAIMNYFSTNFGWPSYAGPGADQDVVFHTGLKSLDYRGNSAWLRRRQVFVIGEDGDNAGNLDRSVSVLGHEFMHAIIQSSSGITNTNDAGAINEHAADILGASIYGEARGDGKFPYQIGADILLPAVRAERKKLLSLAIEKYGFSAEQVARFHLAEPSLRQLYAPALSFAAQFDDLAALRAAYPEDCQPTDENDNCGIHIATGVPNRAVSLLMLALGEKETVGLVFRTVVNRLNSKPSLVDYVVQLFEECRETPALAARCDAVLTSFAQVGVAHPSVPAPRLPAPPPALETPVTESNDILPHSPRASTPLLRFCGWVDQRVDDRISLVDGKFNATVMQTQRVKTTGDFEPLRGLDCACASGHISQVRDDNRQVINVFRDIGEIEDRRGLCEVELAGVKPPAASPAKHGTGTRRICGWVSVESKTQNITLLSALEDVQLIAASKSATRGDFKALYRAQCACVSGTAATSKNGRRFFRAVSAVDPQDPENCSGIPWN